MLFLQRAQSASPLSRKMVSKSLPKVSDSRRVLPIIKRADVTNGRTGSTKNYLEEGSHEPEIKSSVGIGSRRI